MPGFLLAGVAQEDYHLATICVAITEDRKLTEPVPKIAFSMQKYIGQ